MFFSLGVPITREAVVWIQTWEAFLRSCPILIDNITDPLRILCSIWWNLREQLCISKDTPITVVVIVVIIMRWAFPYIQKQQEARPVVTLVAHWSSQSWGLFSEKNSKWIGKSPLQPSGVHQSPWDSDMKSYWKTYICLQIEESIGN